MRFLHALYIKMFTLTSQRPNIVHKYPHSSTSVFLSRIKKATKSRGITRVVKYTSSIIIISDKIRVMEVGTGEHMKKEEPRNLAPCHLNTRYNHFPKPIAINGAHTLY